MGQPKVSVVVPVHNGRDSLRRTFQSIFDQTLPAERIEIIAVDDGSTDGSGAELDRLAAPHARFTVLHQEASGGPGRPRNVGLDHASGEYVFFLDADDYLGPEALERCVAMADENGTDVVVPKYVGVGRKVNAELFARTVAKTTIFDAVPNLYGSITALKLYRRSLLDSHGIRFPERVLSGEDQIFAVRAYFEASGVSVLADYDCYYWVNREDGTSALQQGGAPAETYFPEIRKLLDYVAERTAPGQVRDRLLRRHFAIEVFSRFDPRYQHFSAEEREATRDAVRELVRVHGNAEILAPMSPYSRLLDHALRHDLDDLVDEAARVHATDPPPIVVRGDRAFLAYPGFRDGVPDSVYEIDGPLTWRHGLKGVEWRGDRLVVHCFAYVERVRAEQQTAELILREREGDRAYRVPLEVTGDEEMSAELDLWTIADGRPLPPGRWDMYGTLDIEDLHYEDRLTGGSGELDVPGPRITPVGSGLPVVTPYLTRGMSALAVQVGGLGGHALSTEGQAVQASGHLRLSGALPPVLPGAEKSLEIGFSLRHRESEETRSVEAEVKAAPDRLAVEAEIATDALASGIWDIWYDLGVDGGDGGSGALRVPAPDALKTDRSARLFRTIKGNLSLEVSAGRRWLRHLRRPRRRKG
ncbi:glycosyltransferase family 2 protein [Actinomadura hibisca]|uniref:glycosyltransferase family 2 protein n=1 Tax=Actinomadura hibisca TaxID=68565 RepID=UPI00082D5835|nr:glycosyltransferase family 2 protein [Actinomadura hibisca]